jgi:hypothetical protein
MLQLKTLNLNPANLDLTILLPRHLHQQLKCNLNMFRELRLILVIHRRLWQLQLNEVHLLLRRRHSYQFPIHHHRRLRLQDNRQKMQRFAVCRSLT